MYHRYVIYVQKQQGCFFRSFCATEGSQLHTHAYTRMLEKYTLRMLGSSEGSVDKKPDNLSSIPHRKRKKTEQNPKPQLCVFEWLQAYTYTYTHMHTHIHKMNGILWTFCCLIGLLVLMFLSSFLLLCLDGEMGRGREEESEWEQ